MQISCPIIKQNKDSYVDVLHWGWAHNIAVATEPVIFAAYDHSGCNLENRLSIEEVDDVLTIQMQEGYAESIRKTAKDKEKPVSYTHLDVYKRQARTRRLIERGAVLEGIFPLAADLSGVEVKAFLIALSHLPGAAELAAKLPRSGGKP